MISFFMPSGSGFSELTEKRSRFLGHLTTIKDEDGAKDYIRSIKKQYHDARHNCWCYRIYAGSERFSDDGEPQGSAGMPMLEVFRRENIYNFVCVVTRYFGGVLLGTGGLSRCYSAAAKSALMNAGIIAQGEWAELHFSCPYTMLERYKNELASAGANILGLEYGQDVQIIAQLPLDTADTLSDRIFSLSGGKIRPVRSEPLFRADTREKE